MLNPALPDQISSVIAALQQATPQFLEEATRAAQMSAALHLVGLVLFVLLSVLVTQRLSPMRRMAGSAYGDSKATAWFVSGILSLVSVVLVTVFLPDCVNHLLNARYYAVLDIIAAVRQ